MTKFIEVANAHLLVKEEKDAIKNFKEAASKNVINRADLVTFEQIKFGVIIEANKRKLNTDVIKALASKAGIYNILQKAGYGMRTRVGFVPSELAIRSHEFVVGHYEHSNGAVFKVHPKSSDLLIRGIITYATKHPEVALSSKQANTRLLSA